MEEWTCAIVFVGITCHMLSLSCIGQLYTIRRLLSDILGMVWKMSIVEIHTYTVQLSTDVQV